MTELSWDAFDLQNMQNKHVTLKGENLKVSGVMIG